jgi:hypothetical protein
LLIGRVFEEGEILEVREVLKEISWWTLWIGGKEISAKR